MVETTTPEPVDTDSSLTAVDNVSGIVKNKNTGQNNYNSGVVSAKCVINGFCPIKSKFLVNENLLFNAETVKSFSDGDIGGLGVIKNVSGIYLKEYYNYLSTFIDAPFSGTINSHYPLLPEEETLEDVYFDEQTFIAKTSLFGDLPYNTLEVDTAPGRAVWMSYRVLEPSQNNFVVSDLDSNVLPSSQKSVGDGKAVYSGVNAATVAGSNKGIHWGAEKKTSLFQGEDFFISFRKLSGSVDLTSVDMAPFSYNSLPDASLFQSIDVIYEPDTNNTLPANQGVVSYNKVIKDNTEGTPTSSYEKVKDSMKALNLNDQAYYLIEFDVNDSLATIFIFITQRAYPTCVYVKDGISYNLGSYKNVKGSALIQSEKFVVSVRNHLGYLSITFSGYDDDPWIISSPTGNAKADINYSGNKKQTDAVLITSYKLRIWVGNIPSSFCFSPLSYYEQKQIILPAKPKSQVNNTQLVATDINQSGQETEQDLKYELPYMGIQNCYCLLSTTSDALDANIVEKNPHLANSPLFGNDLQEASEAEIKLPGNEQITPIAPGQVLASNSSDIQSSGMLSPITYFLSLGRYIKAVATENGDADDVVDSAFSNTSTRITLIAFNVKPSSDGHTFSFNLSCELTAGRHIFKGQRFSDGKDIKLVLNGCKTPILNNIRLVAIPKTQTAWQINPVDVSALVMKYNDTWSSSDFHSISHTGNITFLMNKGMSGGLDSLVTKMEGLKNKAFYIEFWAGYSGCNYSQLEPKKAYKLFTGICYGGVLDEAPGQRTMTCKIYDYTKIMEESYIFNSPFYDGMRDMNVIYDLTQMVGFMDAASPPGPAYLCKIQANSTGNQFQAQTLDGRGSFSTVYALPNSYSRLKEAYYKFQDGTSYWENIQKITKVAGKVVFFDTFGMFHYENLPYDKFLFTNANESTVTSLWNYTRYPNGSGQLIFDVLTRERTVEDVYNIIHLMTSTPDYELIIYDKVNWESLYNVDYSGFLGYKKVYLQQDGIFGSLDTLSSLAKNYSKFFIAPVVYKFQSYGLPIRCLDIVSVDGQKLILTNVSTEIDPSKNLWWQNLEGEWYGSEDVLG
jgi:hypothetical protein